MMFQTRRKKTFLFGGSKALLAILGVFAGFMIVRELPSIRRYLRIERM